MTTFATFRVQSRSLAGNGSQRSWCGVSAPSAEIALTIVQSTLGGGWRATDAVPERDRPVDLIAVQQPNGGWRAKATSAFRGGHIFGLRA